MPKPHRRLSVHTRALVTFLVAVLLPALALSIAGLRTVSQERRAAEAQLVRTLDDAVRRAASGLRQEFEWWQQQAGDLPAGSLDLESVPSRLREALTTPGAAVVVTIDQQVVRADPPGQLLYVPACTACAVDPPPAIVEADAAAARGSIAESRGVYRRLLAANSTAAVRPYLLQRIARLDEAAGHAAAAARAYGELSRLPDAAIGPVPASLAGRWGLVSVQQRTGPPGEASDAAFEFYRDLVGGRWTIEKTLYAFYSANIREWLARAPSGKALDLNHVIALEARKQPLAIAVERLAEGMRASGDTTPRLLPTPGGDAFVFWRQRSGNAPARALVVSPEHAASAILPSVLSSAAHEDVGIAVFAADGRQVFPASGGVRPGQDFAASTQTQIQGGIWRLEAWPRDPEAMQSALRRNQRLYVGMLLLMVLSIGFGIFTSVRTLRTQLEVARLKSDFASAVSHEFRSPLTGIRQLTEMLGSGRVPTEARKAEYYAMILEEVTRLSAMVENVLGFARLRDRDGARKLEEVETSAWLREVVERFRHSPAAAGATVVASIPDGMPRVSIDREAFARAIGNLLDNAIKYSPDTRTAWIEARSDSGTIEIQVRDQGIGIDEADRPQLFERFVRGRGDAVQAVPGTGLGLSLVKEVVTAQGGEVCVESRPGGGSTFTIRIGSIA